MSCIRISLRTSPILLIAALFIGSFQGKSFSSTEIENEIQSLSTTADWFFEGAQEGAELGYSVATAGDINGDGYADIVIGSPKYTSPGGVEQEGAVFVFLGRLGGLHTFPDWQASGGKKGSRFGCAVSTAGDVNGDGYDDVIIGADEYKLVFEGQTGEPKSGAAFLYLGSAEGLSTAPAWQQFAEAAEINFGTAVAAAGDVNGDGFDDVIIGAKNFESSPAEANEGKVYLYLGSAQGLSATPDWTYECNAAESSCGYALSSAGDVNGDGYNDIIIGAPHYDGSGVDTGAALIFLGSVNGVSPNPHRLLEIGQAEAWFGGSVAAVGDVNGDGFGDILIGAPHFYPDIEQPENGAAFLYLGSPIGINTQYRWIATGPEPYSEFGYAVHAAGDINRDGYDDVLVGAYLMGSNGSIYQPDEGATYLFLGSSSGLNSFSSWQAYGNKADAWFGFSTSAAGDVNGDGGLDIIVGAPKYKFDERIVMGRAFVFLNTLEDLNFPVFIPLIIR